MTVFGDDGCVCECLCGSLRAKISHHQSPTLRFNNHTGNTESS